MFRKLLMGFSALVALAIISFAIAVLFPKVNATGYTVPSPNKTFFARLMLVNKTRFGDNVDNYYELSILKGSTLQGSQCILRERLRIPVPAGTDKAPRDAILWSEDGSEVSIVVHGITQSVFAVAGDDNADE